MAVLMECPSCRRKQHVKHRLCCSCSENLEKAKRSNRVNFWISYRVQGKQRRECVGTSIEEARDAEGQRRRQKRERKFFDMLPGIDLTWSELGSWYLDLETTKQIRTFDRTESIIKKFTSIHGSKRVSDFRASDLEAYLLARKKEGCSAATIDLDLTYIKAMVRKGWRDNKVADSAWKTLQEVKSPLSRADNARTRYITIQEFQAITDNAASHIRPVLTVAYHTGMRRGEILNLRWPYLDLEKSMIRLPLELTKEGRLKGVRPEDGKVKRIPLCQHVKETLRRMPRSLLTDLVFTYQGNAIRGAIHESLRTAARKAGIPYGSKTAEGFTFHDLRASFKTNLRKARVDRTIRNAILGHSQEGMDAHYDRPEEADLLNAISDYETWFERNNQKSGDQTLTMAVVG